MKPCLRKTNMFFMSMTKFPFIHKTASEYDQEMTQSQTADQPTTPQRRDEAHQQPHDSKENN